MKRSAEAVSSLFRYCFAEDFFLGGAFVAGAFFVDVFFPLAFGDGDGVVARDAPTPAPDEAAVPLAPALAWPAAGPAGRGSG